METGKPINAKRFLWSVGATETKVAKLIGVSRSVAHNILSLNQWPVRKDQDWVDEAKQKMTDLMQEHGLAAEDIVDAWEIDTTEADQDEPGMIKAKRYLLRLGVTEHQASQAIGVSRICLQNILNKNVWPIRHPITRNQARQRLQTLLADHCATQDEIDTAFEVDHKPLPKDTTANTAPVINPDDFAMEAEMLSDKARHHFMLPKNPFIDDVTDANDVFVSKDGHYIRESMFYCARNSGILAVIGESGAGKTTLRKDLIDKINRESSDIVVIMPRTIDKGRLTAGAICDAIISDLSHESPRRSLEAKARQVEKTLANSARAGQRHVLIIEEAHDLTIQTLKYLKRFWELEDGFRRLLGILLIGQPELKVKLDERSNPDAREFIRRCEIAELNPLNGNLEEYLELKFKRVGKSLDEIFERDAFDAIRSRLQIPRRGGIKDSYISMMYPLVVNNLVTKALNFTAKLGAQRVSSEQIKAV